MAALADMLLLALAALFLLPPVVWAWRLALMYLGPSAAPPPDTDLPTAAVVLSLRGGDPSLGDCLRALLRQDYPRYRLLIVVDGPDDPAWGPVRAALAAGHGPNVEVRAEALRAPRSTCSLKVSSHIQAVAQLGDGCEVFALVDADAVVPPDWLRRLVAPFADPAVGATTGVRWYAPVRPTWGALARHLWNCGCQTQVYAFGIPWGGSMAVRAELLGAGGLLREWGNGFADDTAAAELLRRRGLRVRFVPELTIVNREAVGLAAVFGFAARQVINTRLDMARWPLMLAFNVGLTLALAACSGAAMFGLLAGDAWRAGWYGGLVAVHMVGLMSAMALAEAAIRRRARRGGAPLPAAAGLWRYPLAAGLAMAVHGCAVARAALARRVSWRGVEYDVQGAGRVRLVEYRPFRAPVVANETGASIG